MTNVFLQGSRLWPSFKVLLRDYGYRLDGGTLIQMRCAYMPEKIVGRFQSLVSVGMYLCPVIREDEFTNRFNRIFPA